MHVTVQTWPTQKYETVLYTCKAALNVFAVVCLIFITNKKVSGFKTMELSFNKDQIIF